MIKPIQTQYAGILFRSRLEARWAMYFDLLGVEWIYEMEGYELKSGWYLPDFFLPKFRVFCEVKPYDTGKLEHRWLDLVANQREAAADGENETKLILLYGKIHCGSMKILHDGGLSFCKIPHEDSILVSGEQLYFGRERLDSELQVFCDEANSYRF